MLEINSQEDWWKVVDENWDDLVNVISKFYRHTRQPGDKPLLWVIEEAKKQRSSLCLLSVLNRTWEDAPDSPSIHDVGGWGVLCDLCSESWVFCQD